MYYRRQVWYIDILRLFYPLFKLKMHVWDSYLSLNHKVFKDCEMLNLAWHH